MKRPALFVMRFDMAWFNLKCAVRFLPDDHVRFCCTTKSIKRLITFEIKFAYGDCQQRRGILKLGWLTTEHAHLYSRHPIWKPRRCIKEQKMSTLVCVDSSGDDAGNNSNNFSLERRTAALSAAAVLWPSSKDLFKDD